MALSSPLSSREWLPGSKQPKGLSPLHPSRACSGRARLPVPLQSSLPDSRAIRDSTAQLRSAPRSMSHGRLLGQPHQSGPFKERRIDQEMRHPGCCLSLIHSGRSRLRSSWLFEPELVSRVHSSNLLDAELGLSPARRFMLRDWFLQPRLGGSIARVPKSFFCRIDHLSRPHGTNQPARAADICQNDGRLLCGESYSSTACAAAAAAVASTASSGAPYCAPLMFLCRYDCNYDDDLTTTTTRPLRPSSPQPPPPPPTTRHYC